MCKPLFGQTTTSLTNQKIVTQEISYQIPGVSEVFLVWGLNGWQIVPRNLQPKQTWIQNNSMRTLMTRENDKFTVKLTLPEGTTINYGFLITKGGEDGALVRPTWDGDYIAATSSKKILERKTTLTSLRLNGALGFIWSLLIGSGILMLIWILISALPWSPWNINRGLLILSFNIIPLILVLLGGELYLRVQGHTPYFRTPPDTDYQAPPKTVGGLKTHPILGWVSDQYSPEINPQGFRDVKDFSKINSGSDKKRIMFIGDSFVWGIGVKAQENMTNQLLAKLGKKFEIFNVSSPGWGIDQMYLAYHQYRNVINPDIVIMAYIDDDISRVLEGFRDWEGVSKPSFTLKDDQLTLRSSKTNTQFFVDKALEQSVFLSMILREYYLLTEARPIVSHMLIAIEKNEVKNNGQFVVLRIPTPSHAAYLAINQNLNSSGWFVENTKSQFLDPSDEMEKSETKALFLNDSGGHLSIEGNKYIAEYIYKEVFENHPPFLTKP